jgi:MFS transporter, SHS family, lactate transporter
MGGIWGLASATALENLPVQLRGLASGILQEGYALGYLIASVVNLWLVPEQKEGWRALFWTAAGLSFFAAAVRAVLPESEVFLKAQRIEREKALATGIVSGTGTKTKTFVKETVRMLKLHWKLWIYAVLLMSGFNFLSHGSQASSSSLKGYFWLMG